MTPEQQQKMSLRVTALQSAQTLNQKMFMAGGGDGVPDELIDKVLSDAESIYQFLARDAEETPLRKIVN